MKKMMMVWAFFGVLGFTGWVLALEAAIDPNTIQEQACKKCLKDSCTKIEDYGKKNPREEMKFYNEAFQKYFSDCIGKMIKEKSPNPDPNKINWNSIIESQDVRECPKDQVRFLPAD